MELTEIAAEFGNTGYLNSKLNRPVIFPHLKMPMETEQFFLQQCGMMKPDENKTLLYGTLR